MLLWLMDLMGVKPGIGQGSHSYHWANMLRVEGYGQGHMGKHPVKKEPRKLVTVDGKG